MIKQLRVEKLFGQFTYTINFKPTGIAIITGPNGYGKSTILKIIASIVDEGLYEVCQYPFQKLNIVPLSGNEFYIEKNGKNDIEVNKVKLQMMTSREIEQWSSRHSLKYVERIGPNQYFDRRTGNILDDEEVAMLREQTSETKAIIKDRLIAVNFLRAKREKRTTSTFKTLDEEYSTFKKSLGNIKFIREQRLLREEKRESRYYGEEESEVIEVIKEIPNKLKEQIQNTVIRYSQIASQLDSTYPKRLFAENIQLSQKNYLEKLGDIILKQEKIFDYKLIQDMHISSPDIHQEYKPELSTALSIYLSDTTTKLEVFDELVAKIELYKNILDKKLFNKYVDISAVFGLKIVRKDGMELSLDKLSSGEKQIIVLYYDLIFGLENKTILLIDEPEISLHVAWQREMLDDFNKIVLLQKDQLSIIVATHSPQLINNHWNMVIDLGAANEVQ